MKRFYRFLTALALVLVLVASIRGASAYFTTYAEAKGGYVLHLEHQDHLEEDFDEGRWMKSLSITNEYREDARPIFVRAKAFAGSELYQLTYADGGSGKWSDGGDGYWYYSDAVAPGDSTGTLYVSISGVATGEALTEDSEFNVVVIYESCPVQYDAAGTAYADWTEKVTTVEEEGGN